MSVIAGVPVKGFDLSKSRLDLDSATRAELARRLATHTVNTLRDAGLVVVVATGHPSVEEWAARLGVETLDDQGSLDRAARRIVDRAGEQPWMVCHADLPLLHPTDLAPVIAALDTGRPVISPSTDGGTTLLGHQGADIEFAYGPASFHRHLPQLLDPLIVIGPGFGLDLDSADDLAAASAHPRGRWLTEASAG